MKKKMLKKNIFHLKTKSQLGYMVMYCDSGRILIWWYFYLLRKVSLYLCLLNSQWYLATFLQVPNDNLPHNNICRMLRIICILHTSKSLWKHMKIYVQQHVPWSVISPFSCTSDYVTVYIIVMKSSKFQSPQLMFVKKL